MCACNHSHANAYGAATGEEEKHMSLRGRGESMRGADRMGGGWEKHGRSTGGAQLLQSQGRRKQSKSVQPLQESFLPTSM